MTVFNRRPLKDEDGNFISPTTLTQSVQYIDVNGTPISLDTVLHKMNLQFPINTLDKTPTQIYTPLITPSDPTSILNTILALDIPLDTVIQFRINWAGIEGFLDSPSNILVNASFLFTVQRFSPSRNIVVKITNTGIHRTWWRTIDYDNKIWANTWTQTSGQLPYVIGDIADRSLVANTSTALTPVRTSTVGAELLSGTDFVANESGFWGISFSGGRGNASAIFHSSLTRINVSGDPLIILRGAPSVNDPRYPGLTIIRWLSAGETFRRTLTSSVAQTTIRNSAEIERFWFGRLS